MITFAVLPWYAMSITGWAVWVVIHLLYDYLTRKGLRCRTN